jgi:predicted HTH domain antitoxin
MIDTDTLERISELAEIQENVIRAELRGEITPEQAREVLDTLQ